MRKLTWYFIGVYIIKGVITGLSHCHSDLLHHNHGSILFSNNYWRFLWYHNIANTKYIVVVPNLPIRMLLKSFETGLSHLKQLNKYEMYTATRYPPPAIRHPLCATRYPSPAEKTSRIPCHEILVGAIWKDLTWFKILGLVLF